MQAKRIQSVHQDVLVGVPSIVSLVAPTTPREQINFHNIWASFSTEPENSTANAQGIWALMVIPENGTIPTLDIATLNNETNNVYIIACGAWGSSNETPETITVHPETSRTLNPGDALVLEVFPSGVTDGEVSMLLTLCAHTTRK